MALKAPPRHRFNYLYRNFKPPPAPVGKPMYEAPLPVEELPGTEWWQPAWLRERNRLKYSYSQKAAE